MKDKGNTKVSDTPPQFDEMMSSLARQQLGLDARFTVYAVATDQLPAGLARVSLAPNEDGVWSLEEAVHGVVNLGHDAREALAAGSSLPRPRIALPPRGEQH